MEDGDVGGAVRGCAEGCVGVGTAGHHHGELLQGAVARGGELVSCLITMPAPGVGSSARYTSGEVIASASAVPGSATARVPGSGTALVPGRMPASAPRHAPVRVPASGPARVSASGAALVPAREGGAPPLLVLPAWKTKAERAARLALAFIGAPISGRLEIECTVATGVGLGSSTSDVVAAIRAACDAYGLRLGAADVARLAMEAEAAVDPIMFEGEVVLFAQRQGRVLESFGSWIPAFTVLSLDTDLDGAGVDTLALPRPDYTTADLNLFESLVGRAREAFRQRDIAAIAAVATESAVLNQSFLAMRRFPELCAFAREHRALGVQISHSGTLAGVLFDARRVPVVGDSVAQLMHQASALGVRPLGLFKTG